MRFGWLTRSLQRHNSHIQRTWPLSLLQLVLVTLLYWVADCSTTQSDHWNNLHPMTNFPRWWENHFFYWSHWTLTFISAWYWTTLCRAFCFSRNPYNPTGTKSPNHLFDHLNSFSYPARKCWSLKHWPNSPNAAFDASSSRQGNNDRAKAYRVCW